MIFPTMTTLWGHTISMLPTDYPLDPYGNPYAVFLDGGRVDLHRARPGEAPDGTCATDLIASCLDIESAPLWRARQPW